MDSFESLVRLLLELEGNWTRQSEKVLLSKKTRAELGKPSMPRTEIDVVGFNPRQNEIWAMEVKSYLDSPGVGAKELGQAHAVPKGRYKLFTCERYRVAVFEELKNNYVEMGLANSNTKIVLGLSAGKIKSNNEAELRSIFKQNRWVLWSPKDLADKARDLERIGYENDPFVLLSKLLVRNPTNR